MNPTSETQPSPPAWGIRGQYQLQDSTMTLREGLAEYYAVNPGLADPAELEHEPSATFFHRHDSTHVIFGTHTGPSDEVGNDWLTLFGADVGFVRYLREFMATTEVKGIAQAYANASVFRLLWHGLRLLPIARRYAKSMHRKWPWQTPEAWLDRPLGELREELGIKVLHTHVDLGLKLQELPPGSADKSDTVSI